jgi:ABC-type Fe3+-hydroxamate transport system substrate-binding protein
MIRALWLCTFVCLSAWPVQAGERILALSPHACEILAAIGAVDEIVGVVEYCDYPEMLTLLPGVGGYNRIHVESAMSLKPTLAVVMNDGTKAVKKLRKLGVRVVASNPTNINDMLAEIERLGLLSGHAQEAERLVERLEQRLDMLDALKVKRRIPVFYEIWSNPLMVAGGGSLIHDVLSRAGLENVFGDLPMEGPRVNVEAVIRAAPQVIIIPTENRNILERKRFWKQWLGEDVSVISVHADLLHRPTPRLIDGLEELMEKISGLPASEAIDYE